MGDMNQGSPATSGGGPSRTVIIGCVVVAAAAVVTAVLVAVFAGFYLFYRAGDEERARQAEAADFFAELAEARMEPAPRGLPGRWELREGGDTLTVTFGEDCEAVLDWNSAGGSVHVDGFCEVAADTVTVESLGRRKWVFRLREGRLYFLEEGREKEMTRKPD